MSLNFTIPYPQPYPGGIPKFTYRGGGYLGGSLILTNDKYMEETNIYAKFMFCNLI